MCACNLSLTDPRPLTTGTAARLLGTSAEFIRQQIEVGELVALAIGRPGKRQQYRIPVAALRRYIAARLTVATCGA